MFKELDEVSVRRLKGVHPDLVKVADYAAGVSSVQFIITQGLRTQEEQEKLVAEGKSKTMNSRHLTGHAVDVAAKVNGKISWNMDDYFKIAEAFKTAAKALGIPIRWGGCWEVINDLPSLGRAQSDYAARVRKEGRKPLIDGPHFELPKATYP